MMPQVNLIGPGGYSAMIMTRDRDMLAAWFAEWLPRLWPDVELGEPMVVIHPLWSWGTGDPGDPDWLTDTRAFGPITIPRDPGEVLPYLDKWRAQWKPQW